MTVHVGHLVDLSRLKVGDIVNAKYYRSVAFLLSTPGETAPEDAVAQVAIARKVEVPGGDVLQVVRISATVVGIDLADHSVDVVDPSGGAVRTIIVTDPDRIALLPKLNIGDTVTAVVSQLLAVEVTSARIAAARRSDLYVRPAGRGRGGRGTIRGSRRPVTVSGWPVRRRGQPCRRTFPAMLNPHPGRRGRHSPVRATGQSGACAPGR